MLKKTMTYEDYNGEKVTEDFYFSLSKAELIEMEMLAEDDDGLRGKLTKIVKEDNREEILKTFREIILMSVGRRSEDGRRFIKNEEIRQEFQQTPAFSDLLVEFYTDTNAAALFVAGIVPSDMGAAVKQSIESGDIQLVPDLPSDSEPAKDEPEKTWKDFSRQELVDMNTEEFDKYTKGLTLQSMPRDLLAVAMQRRASEAAAE